MSTATMIFDLSDMDDRLEHLRCVKSKDMAMMLWELDTNAYRKFTKYNDRQEAAYQEGIEEVFEYIRDLFKEHHVDPDKLII